MKINGVGEFHSFIMNNGLSSLSPELSALDICMSEYNRLCSCDSHSFRESKLATCRTHYVTFARHANQFKSTLFSKTTDSNIIFAIEGQQITSLQR